MSPKSFFFSLAWLAMLPLAMTTLSTCPTDLACCSTPGRRSIFPREECPAGIKKCCEKTDKVLRAKASTLTLQCGNSNEAQASLTTDVKPCPSDPSTQCLHFNFGPTTDGINYKDVHLGLSATPFLAFVPPGLLNSNSFCALTNNGASADCYVPLSTISTTYFASGELCPNKLHVVAHVSYPDSGDVNGNTCYGTGADIPQTGPGKGNWAMQFTVDFTCTDECVKDCCCPAPPVPDVWCPIGTAYGHVVGLSRPQNSLLPLPNTCKHWGWYTPTNSLPVAGTLYVGAGGNDISKATNVGSFTLSASSVTYSLYATKFKTTETHVYAKCSAPTSCQPGQLGYTATNNVATFPTLTCSTFYFIVHAAVSQAFPGGTDCANVPVAPP